MQQSTLRAWVIWLIAGIFYLYEFIHRIIISVMIPELSASFNTTMAAIGVLSAYYFYAYAMAQIPLGLIIDRFGTRKILSLSCLLIAASSLLFATTNDVTIASICRLLIGLGSATAFVGCLKLAATWFNGNQFGLIVGLTNMLGVTGAILGGHPVAHLVDDYGWRVVMLGSAGVGLLITILLWSIVRDQRLPSKHTFKAPNFIKRLAQTVKCSQNWWAAGFASLMVAPIVAYSELWGVSYLSLTYNLPRTAAAQISSLTFIGIAIGGPAIGFISDKLGTRKLPMAIGVIGALTSMMLISNLSNISIFTLCILHICFGFFSSSMLLCFSIISEANQDNLRATAIGLTNTIIMGAGAVLQTVSAAIINIVDLNFKTGFSLIMLCYILAFVCFKFIRETRCHFNDY